MLLHVSNMGGGGPLISIFILLLECRTVPCFSPGRWEGMTAALVVFYNNAFSRHGVHQSHFIVTHPVA